MIKISSEELYMPTRLWNTREDLNTDEIYVLTANDGKNVTWDLYLRSNGLCRIVQWEQFVDEDGNVIDTEESSLLVGNLLHFVNLLQEASEMADGYFDNDTWSI